ncbi:MAG: archaeal heat shock protein Hsp20 [Candidatus Heimdallarchaeota archaeon]
MSWWNDDWPFRKKKSRRGYWDDIFERMLKDINAMFRDFARWPDFPPRIRHFDKEIKVKPDKDLKIRRPFVYGFKYSLGPEGQPQFEEFGNVRPSPRGAITFESREPLIDIIEGPNELKIIVELPGVRKEDIKLKTTDRMMQIKAGKGEYMYQKKLTLPYEVQPETAKAQYNNGVLEVTIKIRHPKEGDVSGQNIPIE